jgi:hypothetical protein
MDFNLGDSLLRNEKRGGITWRKVAAERSFPLYEIKNIMASDGET